MASPKPLSKEQLEVRRPLTQAELHDIADRIFDSESGEDFDDEYAPSESEHYSSSEPENVSVSGERDVDSDGGSDGSASPLNTQNVATPMSSFVWKFKQDFTPQIFDFD